MASQEEIAALKTLYPKIAAAEEGGVTFYRIEEMTLPNGANPQNVTALICPTKRDGYESRLFLSSRVTHRGPGQNWNPQSGAVILGQTWWAVSWQTRAGQTLTQMLLDHLGAFRG